MNFVPTKTRSGFIYSWIENGARLQGLFPASPTVKPLDRLDPRGKIRSDVNLQHAMAPGVFAGYIDLE